MQVGYDSLPTAAPEVIEPTAIAPGSLSLFQAVEIGLAQNPDLMALRQNEGVSLGMLGVAETYPFNPYVQIQVLPDPKRADGTTGQTNHYVLLQQTIQLAHQRRHREEAALASLSSVRWNIVQAEILSAAVTQRLYFTALYQRGIRDINEANANLSNRLLDVSEKQFNAGQIAAADLAIVRLDTLATRQQARLAEANYQTALLDLRRQLNLPLHVPLELQGDLADWPWTPVQQHSLSCLQHCCELQLGEINAACLAELLAAGRPDVMAAEADVAAARATTDLARSSRVPDLMIGPYYQKNENGTEFLGFRAQSDIPIWNTGAPLVRQREAEVNQRQAAWQAIQFRATREVETALDRYDRARSLAADLPKRLATETPQELTRLEAQFQAGDIDIVRVITARTSLLQAHRAQLDILNEMAQSAAALASVTGLPPQTLLAPGEHLP